MREQVVISKHKLGSCEAWKGVVILAYNCSTKLSNYAYTSTSD